jgi:Zn-dependent membrane protease YugP
MENMGLYLLALIIPLIAQIYVSNRYKKYSNIENDKKISGFEVARKILDKNGLNDLYIVETKGTMSDHYDPKRKTVRLSSDVFHGTSIASLAIAAHECGHAIQDKDGYTFMKIRSLIAPFASVSSKLGYVVIMIGLLFSLFDLVLLGIALELVILLFQLVTLPVEFNASHRALKILNDDHLIESDEVKNCRKVLTAAALTYVASVAASVLENLRLVLMFTRRD